MVMEAGPEEEEEEGEEEKEEVTYSLQEWNPQKKLIDSDG